MGTSGCVLFQTMCAHASSSCEYLCVEKSPNSIVCVDWLSIVYDFLLRYIFPLGGDVGPTMTTLVLEYALFRTYSCRDFHSVFHIFLSTFQTNLIQLINKTIFLSLSGELEQEKH